MKKLLLVALSLMMIITPLMSLAYDGELITIVADSDADPFTWDPANDAIAKFIEDEFGITFQQSETNFYNNDFAMTQLAAQDEKLPDVFAADILYYPQLITQFIPEEMITEIPEELIEKYPLTKARLENDEVAQITKKMYGGYFFLPKPDSADPTIYVTERKGIFIRKDWLEKLGLDLPTSWEELYEVAHAFTHNDPDGNGINDTYGLTGDGMGQLRFFFSASGVSNRHWNKNEDGTWSFGALDERNIPVLEWMRKMYEDGTIDPDFGASTWRQGLQKFSSNQFGLCVRNADADWINQVFVNHYGAANPDVNPFDVLDVIPGLGINKGDDVRMEKYVSCMVATMFGTNITEEQMDRFLAYYEYLLSDEGRYLRMGLKDVDYKIDENGEVTIIRDEAGAAPALATKYPSIGVTHWTSWGFEMHAYPHVEFFDKYNDEIKEVNARACALRNEHPVTVNPGTLLIDDTVVTDAVGTFTVPSEYWAIVTGTEPVADMFAAMKERILAGGFEQAAEVVQAFADEHGW